MSSDTTRRAAAISALMGVAGRACARPGRSARESEARRRHVDRGSEGGAP